MLAAPRLPRSYEPVGWLRLLPTRDVVRDGVDAKVVGVGSVGGTPVVSAVFLADSLRLVHVG